VGGATQNAGVENAGASKIKGWKSRHQSAGVEIAGVEIVAPEGRGWKMREKRVWKVKIPVLYHCCRVEHWISLPKWVTTANRTNVIQNDVTHNPAFKYVQCLQHFGTVADLGLFKNV